MQEGLSPYLVKIPQDDLHDKDKFPVGMLAAQVVHPVGFQQGRRDIDIAWQYLFLGILQHIDFSPRRSIRLIYYGLLSTYGFDPNLLLKGISPFPKKHLF